MDSLQRRLDTLRGEAQAVAAQIEQQQARLQIAEDTQRRYQGLADQDFIAREELQQKNIDLSEQRSRLRGLEREVAVKAELVQSLRRRFEQARVTAELAEQQAPERIKVIDPPVHGANRSDPGGLLSQYLARHGVRAEIDVLAKTLPRVSDVLLRHARDISADMVVMGAYGHSRFREAILGGATRNMLEQSEITVFMTH
jgi:nucleotide-binding universal stress UspA family protein